MPRERSRNITSWDGKDEEHPFEPFVPADSNATKLILGSFPPNKFTLYTVRKTRCDIDFFYGSKDNSFWDLFILAKQLNMRWPDNLEDLKRWLTDNNWAITDIVNKTTRKKDSAADSDLRPIEWNTRIINEILTKNPIQSILFTSNWVKNKFDKKVRPHLTAENDYHDFTLISPSPAGLIRTNWATSTLPKRNGEFLEEYRKRYYDYVLNIV